jgi:hypothetical protein
MEVENSSDACVSDAIQNNCCQNHFQEFSIEDDYAVSTYVNLKANIIFFLSAFYSFFVSLTEFSPDFFSFSPPEDFNLYFPDPY